MKNSHNRILLIIIVVLWGFGKQGIEAQTIHGKPDAWFFVNAKYKINEKWSIGSEFHFRLDNWVLQPEQFIIRPSVSYKIKPNLEASLGYSYILTFPYGDFALEANRPEHNIWEQFAIKQKVGKVTLVHRYRLEQRFQSMFDTNIENYTFNQFTYSNRFRYRITVKIPLYKTLSLDIFDEIWVRASGDFKQISYDRNWFYAGLSWKALDFLTLQLGYMHQYVQNNPSRYEQHHTVQLSVKFSIKNDKTIEEGSSATVH